MGLTGIASNDATNACRETFPSFAFSKLSLIAASQLSILRSWGLSSAASHVRKRVLEAAADFDGVALRDVALNV